MGSILDILMGIPINPVLRAKIELKEAELEQRKAECESLKLQNIALVKKASLLEAELAECKKKLEVALELVASLKNPLAQQKYDEVDKNILEHAFNSHSDITLHSLSHICPDIGVLQYHLDKLQKDRLIVMTRFAQKSSWADIDTPSRYAITQEGRTYVMEIIRKHPGS